MANYVDSWCQIWYQIRSNPPKIKSGTINVLQEWLRGWGVLDKLLFMLERWDLVHKSIITYHDNPRCQKLPHPPSIQSGTFKVLQVWLPGRRVLNSLLIKLESWNLVHMSRITYDEIHIKILTSQPNYVISLPNV